MATPIEERVARLEGSYAHLATKSDIAELKSYIAERENRLIRWMVSLVLGGMVGVSALTIIISRFLT